jgi:pyruvate/2-oxoglutarate dehydrogenase complex dihydrolipoamide acyltransferase (E2) component
MKTEVSLPDLGMPARLSVWFADPGDPVYAGDRLVEILVNGATFDVSAPTTGYLVEKWAWPGDELIPGQSLGVVESEE